MVFETFSPPGRRYSAGAAYLRGQAQKDRAQAVVLAVHGLDEMQQAFGDLVVETRLPAIGAAPSTSYEGDGFVVVRHPDTQVVTSAVQKIVRTVRIELA
jgi:hypothetical protein